MRRDPAGAIRDGAARLAGLFGCSVADLAAVAGLILMAVVVFAPVIFGGEIFLNGNVFSDHYPRLAWASQELSQGRIPLWSDDLAFGFPVYLDQFQVVNPAFMLLLRLLPYIDALNWVVVLGFLTGSIVTFLFCRSQGISALGSILAAIAYSYATEQVYWGQEPPWALGVFIFPALALLAGYLAKGRSWRVLVSAAIYAYCVVGGYIEMTIYATALGFLWVAFGLPDVKRRYVTLARYCLTVAVGAILVSPWLLPAISFISETTRSGGVKSASGDGPGVMTLLDAAHMIFPVLSIRFAPSDYLKDGTIYVFLGIIPLVLAVHAFLKRRADRRVRFFFAVAVFCLMVFVPFVSIYPVIHQLPILNLFRFAWKWSYPFMFAVAVLAGFGLDALVESAKVGGRFLGAVSRMSAIVVGVYVAVWGTMAIFEKSILAYVSAIFESHFYVATLGRPLDYYVSAITLALHDAIYGAAPWEPGMLAGLLPLIALVVLLYPRLRAAISSRNLGYALVGATAISLVLAAYGNVSYTGRGVVTDTPAIAGFLKDHVGDGRIAEFVPYFSDYQDKYGLDLYSPLVNQKIGKELLYTNWSLLYGFDSVVFGSSLVTTRPYRMSLAVIGNGARDADSYRENLTVTPEERASGFSRIAPLLRMLGVGYVVSSFGLDAPFVEESRATTTLGFPVIAYRLDDSLPTLFVATSTVYLPDNDEEGAWDAVMAERDFGARTYVECGNCGASTTSTDAHIESSGRLPDGIEAKVVSGDGTWLIFSRAYLSAWRATVDGEPAPIRRANYVFQAVWVPPGDHDVVIRHLGFWGLYLSTLHDLVPWVSHQ